MRLSSAVTAVLGLALVSAGCTVTVDSHSEIVRQEKRFAVDGRADVRISTFDGSIEIRSWDKADVVIEIEKRGPSKAAVEGLEVISTQKGNLIELEVKRPRSESFSGIGLHRTANARLIVSVPRETDIRARSGDGSIRIDRVAGRIDLRTGDGSIRAADVSGDLTLDTGDGSITVDGAEGKLSVDTGDGSVSVSGNLGALKLHTGDGSVVYRAAPGSTMSEPWEIVTGDGTVSLYLPAQFGAELDAHTGDGTIRNDLNVEDAGEERGRRTLRGRIGGGGKLLRVRTGDGSIHLKLN
ncbi:MAG TPA: DUF4097 family beta strand repeat-containing protein [Vicinamibacterales bacterium]|nr:DUF4097 family beta strand repeat-containing protein [Vicinamibacterales bacterium]